MDFFQSPNKKNKALCSEAKRQEFPHQARHSWCLWMLMTPSLCNPVLAAILLLSCAIPVESQNLQLPALPFDYADLEPAIDSETMTIHHMVYHLMH